MTDHSIPRFCERTGEALNAAALALVREATSAERVEQNAGKLPEGSILKKVPIVKLAPGTWKYVLIQLTADGEDGAIVVVRSYAHCAFHADNFAACMREVKEELGGKGVRGRVLGGGRVRHEPESKRAFVYGYSKTFGRTPGCNERAAVIIEREFDGYETGWSDDGY
jgi:phosphohistidine phosphatase